MKKEFLPSWKRSSQPRRQIKFRENAPLHIKRKLLAARLSKELTKKYATRNIPLRKGDKVKVVRGQYKGHIGKIERVDTKKLRIYVGGMERTKTGGTKSLYPLYPSKVIIQELILDDARRKQVLERRREKHG